MLWGGLLRSLKKFNAAAGSAFTRWEQVVKDLEFVAMLNDQGHDRRNCDILKPHEMLTGPNERGILNGIRDHTQL